MILHLKILLWSFFAIAHVNDPTKWDVAVVDIPPSAYSEDHEVKGFLVDLIHEISNQSKLKSIIVLASRKRTVEMLMKSEIDSTIMFELKDKAQNLRKIELYDKETYLLTSHERPFSSAKDFKGRVGQISGACPTTDVYPQWKILQIKNPEQGFKLVNVNRLEGFCVTASTFHYWCQKMHLKEKNYSLHLLGKKTLWLYFSPQFPAADFQRIQDGVEKLKSSGGLERFEKKFKEPVS